MRRAEWCDIPPYDPKFDETNHPKHLIDFFLRLLFTWVSVECSAFWQYFLPRHLNWKFQFSLLKMELGKCKKKDNYTKNHWNINIYHHQLFNSNKIVDWFGYIHSLNNSRLCLPSRWSLSRDFTKSMRLKLTVRLFHKDILAKNTLDMKYQPNFVIDIN